MFEIRVYLCYFTEIVISIILQLYTAIGRVTVGNSGTSQFFVCNLVYRPAARGPKGSRAASDVMLTGNYRPLLQLGAPKLC